MKASHKKAKITKWGIASNHFTSHSQRLSLVSSCALTWTGYLEVVMTGKFTSFISISSSGCGGQWRKSRGEVTNDPDSPTLGSLEVLGGSYASNIASAPGMKLNQEVCRECPSVHRPALTS
jgi:hypothetical protein